MNAERRLGQLFEAMHRLGLPVLVMGGHAVRYYGIDRSTFDFDFHVALEPAAWKDLCRTLTTASELTVLKEGPTWRAQDFRRFIIGVLPGGRDERMEIWRRNHLLAPWTELRDRHEEGSRADMAERQPAREHR